MGRKQGVELTKAGLDITGASQKGFIIFKFEPLEKKLNPVLHFLAGLCSF